MFAEFKEKFHLQQMFPSKIRERISPAFLSCIPNQIPVDHFPREPERFDEIGFPCVVPADEHVERNQIICLFTNGFEIPDRNLFEDPHAHNPQ